VRVCVRVEFSAVAGLLDRREHTDPSALVPSRFHPDDREAYTAGKQRFVDEGLARDC
jgi:hypothetical protein